MRKKTLILQHEEVTPAGSSLKWLEKNQFPYEIIRVDKKAHMLELTSEVSGVIICGGTQNVDQEMEFPWLKKEKTFISECLSKKIPTLGLCLGAQLIADVSGARVFKAEKWEYGWQEIQPASHVSTTWKDLFSEPRKVFQAHGYRFELPKGYHSLASSPACEFQGFYADQILGFQFHPEVDTEWIQLGIKGFVPTGEFCQTPQEIVKDNSLFLQKNEDWYFQILNRFFEY